MRWQGNTDPDRDLGPVHDEPLELALRESGQGRGRRRSKSSAAATGEPSRINSISLASETVIV